MLLYVTAIMPHVSHVAALTHSHHTSSSSPSPAYKCGGGSAQQLVASGKQIMEEINASKLRSQFLHLLRTRRSPQVPLSVELGHPVLDPMYQETRHPKFSEAMESCPKEDIPNLKDLKEENLYLRTEAYASRGYVAVAIDSRYHGERASSMTTYRDVLLYHHGEKGIQCHSYLIQLTEYLSILQVWDLMKLADYLTQRADIDPSKIGITGESLGGMHAWFAAAADTRYAVAVPIIGVQGFRWAIDHNKWQSRVDSIKDVFEEARVDLDKSVIDKEVVEKVWDRIAPGLASEFDSPYTIPIIAPRPLLILNGEKDPRCPLEGLEIPKSRARKAYEEAHCPDKFKMDDSGVTVIGSNNVDNASKPIILVESIKIFEFEVFPRFFVIVLYAPVRNLKSVTMSSSYLPATTESLDQAQEAKKPSEAISILYRILENPSSSAEALRIKEKAISNLADLLREENRAEELRSLLTQLRPFFSLIPKAKTAKIVRSIIDAVAKIPNTSDLQISLCKEMVQWTRTEKRTFLRQRVEARLASLLMESKEYSEALALLSSLIKEVRRLDDKLLLVDIELLESKLHFSLRNLPKAKASLTAARTAANAIYVPPDQQGTIDLQSGILHAEEKDYKTGYSYFYEAFEAFNALEDPRAIYSLKYMLLCKIMVSQADDVAGILSSAKVGLQYQGPEVDAMKAVAHAHAQRSLRLFETALRDFKAQLEEDPIVHRHLSSLYDTLLEQNLCRLIEPFSRVEIAHIAELIELPVDHVEKKLSQMILDKKFAGTLDQGAGCLIIFDDPKTDAIYPATLETISNIGKVVDSLYVRSAKIMA
ncbi:hypothetical protein RHGRI_005340 [Rhododendron griersonianum]|uniref:PCI domain-containing protein n=1 Tax=Rhododendron griersonianum TaxID=479676 RepID=A0AAV6LCQ2_9ERIC|nr:hypothetical protein RHGRI_005340 [Rhododendron griersonianum]